ncbi:unnamed protein product [Vicia faba]|uniref:Uncharacterized protein n=1 Tax=Vicia faba TaxID=3906 RepID=A0AAV1B7A7_VICFA|nr:unnamed protein product [Vicia faba]
MSEHQPNSKLTSEQLNSKDDSRLEGDQKKDYRSPKRRKLVILQCMPMERKVTKIDPYDHNKELPIRLLKQEFCWLKIPSAKALSLPINDDLSSANYSNKALANLVE